MPVKRSTAGKAYYETPCAEIKKEVSAASKGQRKNLFETSRECEKKISEYFGTYLTESGEIADIESLADYLGSTRDEIMAMMSDGKFGPSLRRARNRIAKIKKQLAFEGKISASVLSFDLKNNHGYRDKPEDIEAGVNNNEQVVFKGKTEDWAE